MSRPPRAANPLRIRFAEFELDEANASLRRQGKEVALAPTPFDLLCALARGAGALLTKDALLDTVWGHQFVSESVLKTAVSDLRTALGDSPREPRIIETVSRRGYRFIAAAAAVTPEPPAVATREPPASPSFVGRAGVVTRLHKAWQRAGEGQRAVVWIAGEPGIGKSTLIEHFSEGLGDVARARGQCVEHYGAGEPYLPVLEALAMLCRADPALPALLRSVAPTWLLQLPWLSSAEDRESLRRDLAGVGAERMLREMGELLDRYTEHRPLLLITEDLHWSDRATIQLIDHVARRRGHARLMWLASFRLAEVVAQEHPLNPLRRELRLHRLCEEVVLDPFSESEVAAYLAQRSASLARDEAFVRALHERTDGVPLFVSSVVTDVMDRSDDDTAVESRLAAVAVPDNLAAIIDHYIARLDTGQRTLLAAAAVCGVDFPAETVAAALGQDPAAVAQRCDDLVRGHVWLVVPRARPGGDAAELPHSYSFRHALFRQVLYERTPVAVRVQLHRDVGAALEQERAAGGAVAASVLAMHFDRGRQPLAALRHYADAAEAALRHFSPATSMGFTERALLMLKQAPAGDERNALEISLATLQGMSAFQTQGVGADAKDAFARAYALLADAPAHPIRGRLLHGYGYLLNLRGEYTGALEVAERAEALGAGVHDQTLTLAACFLHAEAHHLKGQTQAARSWFERGIAVAQALDQERNEVFAADPQVALLGMLGIELVRCGLLAQGRAHVRQANRRAHELRQPMTRLVAAWHEALLEVRLDNAERLATLADEMQALVEEFSIEQGRAACRWFRGWAQARLGRPRDGHRLIREGYELSSRLGMRAGASEVLGYAAQALLLAGDWEAAQAQLQEALQVADDLGERVYLPQLWLLDAALARAQGRPSLAAAHARSAVEEARAQESPWIELLSLVDLGEYHALQADERQALEALVHRLPEANDTPAMHKARFLLAAGRPG
jgi:DNA-binding winged helix-turn-helix (wHTH) protein/tetratricopeptide (TPR) repeat protein